MRNKFVSVFSEIAFFLIFYVVNVDFVIAKEGLWVPAFIEQHIINEMQSMGLAISVSDIYCEKNPSYKDAVIQFDGGCTGAIISDKGLIITNYHCSLEEIQNHSSLSVNYFKKGFWAGTLNEELVNPGLTARILIRTEDVTEKVFAGISAQMDEYTKKKNVKDNIYDIENEAVKDTHFIAKVKSYYHSTKYYLTVYEEFKDIRLVGAPPISIGKFGGDADNWIWPRHTGDFTLFRIYSDKNNKPAEYSKENQPYKPKKYFNVSLNGTNKDDFTLVYGFPGKTSEYLSSFAIQLMSENSLPNKIKLRDSRLKIIQELMNNDPEIELKYVYKIARISNSKKKWEGILNGIKRLDVVKRKKDQEAELLNWLKQNDSVENKNILSELENYYNDYKDYSVVWDYWVESVMAIELYKIVSEIRKLIVIKDNYSKEDFNNKFQEVKINSEKFYKNYSREVDENVFSFLVSSYFKDIPVDFFPAIYTEIESKYKGDFEKYAKYLYAKTIFVDSSKIFKLLEKFDESSIQKILRDPGYKFIVSFIDMYLEKISFVIKEMYREEEILYKRYFSALSLKQNNKLFYPDANSTLRISYGKVEGYYPSDAVRYDYFTTLAGIIEKEDLENRDYNIPESLKALFRAKDYSNYGYDNEMRVCFTASNHTSGGNSGSPVLNGKGNLIGINFDRNWEGAISDIIYDPELCRNIVLDIRYVMFIIEKYAGAKHLINEIEFTKD